MFERLLNVPVSNTNFDTFYDKSFLLSCDTIQPRQLKTLTC